MPLSLTYRIKTTIPLEIEGLTPNWAVGKSVEEIAAFQVFHGNQKAPLVDFFEIAGDASDGEIEFFGDLSGVHWVGAGMTDGVIRVHGSVGRHAGSQMGGGKLYVNGDAAGWAGAEMRRGLIHIRGSAGDNAGGIYRGSGRGMTGGMLLIDGNAGQEVGVAMRRGVIAVGGHLGDLAGFNMIAGTILVLGRCGIRPVAGMRRGTLAVLGEERPQLLPSFRYACDLRPPSMKLLLGILRKHGFAFDDGLLESDYELFRGDLVSVGRGEVLYRKPPSASMHPTN